MTTLTVFRRDDVPKGSVYCIPHEGSAVRMEAGETVTLPTGIYAHPSDPRSDKELRALMRGEIEAYEKSVT